MKFIHSIPTIITQILFVQHLYTVYSSATTTTTTTSEQQKHEQQQQQEEATTTILPTPNMSEQQDDNYFEVSEQNRRIIIEQAKASLLKVLGLKEVPKTQGNKPKTNNVNKAIVPYAMFEEYRKLRDSVREYIPEDRDFYGKINVHDLEKRSHVDFWNVVYNKYPGYDIEIDMGNDESEITKFLYKGDYERLTFVKTLGEPEDVPKQFEHILPPHLGGTNNQKPFISVHLKFNLSQEVFINPISVDDLQAAELHLTRDRIELDYGGLTQQQSTASSEPLFEHQDTSSSELQQTAANVNQTKDDESNLHDHINRGESSTNSIHNLPNRTPRYQRIYILHVLGYDKHNEPITRIHDSQIIDTHRSTTLMFDIYLILKRWIMNPADNYGIIVRVTNDDKDPRLMRQQYEQQQISTSSDDTTNASKTKQSNTYEQQASQIATSGPKPLSLQILDHVRLKREFRSTSEIDEVWYQKQPSIYIFSSPPESARRHVKRTIGANNVQTTSNSGRGSSTVNRNKSANQKKTTKAAEKCSRKSLEINFDEVGWSSWIIAPNSYYANYCLGDCSYPMNDIQNASNHAIIQSIFHSVGRVVPRSCCAPTKLSNMAILYQLDGIVQMKHYDDMVVESCGCV